MSGTLGAERMVHTADGRRLRVMVDGDGEDLVVLEAGLGASAVFWALVHRGLAAFARVVAYDRAGYGASDPAAGPRDLARLADDLEAVIGAFGHERLVLVGHSWGGPIVRTVAARRVGDAKLAGVVLVDQSDEHERLYLTRAMQVFTAIECVLFEPLARTGLLRHLIRHMAAPLPEPFRSAFADACSTMHAAQAMRAEDEQLTGELRRLHREPLDLGALPVSVLSGRRASVLTRWSRDGLSAAHRETAKKLAGGHYVEATESGHMIPLSEPQLVIAEVLSLLAPTQET